MSKEPNKFLAYQKKVKEGLNTAFDRAINSCFPEDHLPPHLKKPQLDFKKELGTGIQENQTKVKQLISSATAKINPVTGAKLRKILEKESLLGFLEEEILHDGKQKGFLPKDLRVDEGSALEMLEREKSNFDEQCALASQGLRAELLGEIQYLKGDFERYRSKLQVGANSVETHNHRQRNLPGEPLRLVGIPAIHCGRPCRVVLERADGYVKEEIGGYSGPWVKNGHPTPPLDALKYFWILQATNALTAASQEPNSTYEDFVREFSQRESFSDPKKFLQNSYLDGELPLQKKYFEDPCDELFINDMCKRYPTAYAYASDCTMKDLPITKKLQTGAGRPPVSTLVQGSPFLRQSAIATGFIDYEKLSLVGEMLLDPDLILSIPGQIVPIIPELFFGLDKKTFAGFLSELDEEYKKNPPHKESEVSDADHRFSYLSKRLFEAAAKHLDLPYSNLDDLFGSKKEHGEPRDYSQGIYSIINEYVMNECEAHRILEREIRSEEPSPNAMRRKFHDAKEFAEQEVPSLLSTRRGQEINNAQSFATQPFLARDPRILD